MEVGLVKRIDIDAEMQQSYLDYAMSVIVARALPDARDGLKPVHRRILHAMYSMGIRADSEYKKSARIVGEVLGKFHPHGDMAVYDAMARMAQAFSMRYTLVDGQGNFGSIDGDPPAAMRYTETRLAALSMAMMADIEKETVDFSDNFDGTLLEPVVLPSALPNLLVNGATGIAVGMATSIPPHNMNEVCNALVYMLENWTNLEKVSIDDLMVHIKGPDFPTGGIILRKEIDGSDGFTTSYGSGRGKITVQAKAHVEGMGRGRSRIIVTELPYQTNKSSLIERIADLARTGAIEGISDLRDESDRQGMRIVIELAKSADPEKVLAGLYRRTPMQTTFSIIMLALVDGEPRLLNLKQALRVFLDHRIEVIQRKSEYELSRAREQAHILEGIQIALENINGVIQIIRNAKDANQANTRLRKKYEISDAQARAILEMPLRRLASLERKKIKQEFAQTQRTIKTLEDLLASDRKLRNAIIRQLQEIRDQFGDRRRTQIFVATAEGEAQAVLTATDLASTKDTWVVLTQDGRLSRTPSARLPRLAERTSPRLVIGAQGRDILYLFDENGNGCAIPVHTVPECDSPQQGNPVDALTPFSITNKISSGIALPPDQIGVEGSKGHLIFATESGMIKKTSLTLIPMPSAKTFPAIRLGKGDRLSWVHYSSGADEIILITSNGFAIRFSESEVRPMGLNAAGVMGIRLEKKSKVVGMDMVQGKGDLLVLTSKGIGKRSALSQFPTQGRYGKGVLAWKSGEEVQIIGACTGTEEQRVVIHLSRGAARSTRFADVRRRPRASSGLSLFEVAQNNRVIRLARVLQMPDFQADKQQAAPPSKPESSRAKKGPSKSKPRKSRSGSKS